MDGAIIKDAKRLGRSRVDDDFTDDVARLGPDHSDRVSGAWIWEADPEVVVDGEISIGSFGRSARSRRAIGARLEELEDGMSGVPKLTWLDGDRLDEHSPVSQQGGPVAREALVRVHMRDPRNPILRRIHLGFPADVGHVECNTHGRRVASRSGKGWDESQGNETSRQDDGHYENRTDGDARSFVSVWLLLDFFLIILSAAAFGGAPAFALLLFVPIVVLLLAMRSVSGSTGRLVLLIFVVIFGALQALSTGALLFLGAVLVALFILGFSILELMRDLRSFFDYFALRHRVIQRVRQADPVVYVPEGKDAVQRILSYLAATSSDVRGMMAVPGAVVTPALLTGKTGLTYSFDAYVRREPSSLWRFTSLGAAGFAVFVKAFERAPTLADLQALKTAIEDTSAATKIPPARILVLWRSKGDESVTADVYDFLTKESARVRIRGSTFVCSLELAIERDDGTYDFIPVVVEPVMSGTGTPTAAGIAIEAGAREDCEFG